MNEAEVKDSEETEEVADQVEDEEISEKAVAEHAEEDAPKWEKAFGMIDDLTKRLDSFEKWVNESIGGVDKSESDEAEDTAADSGNIDEEEIAQADKDFYDRQASYLKEGGY